MKGKPHRTSKPRQYWGVRLLAAFFAFGALMCALTIFLLVVPGTALDESWRFKPEAHRMFVSIGLWAVVLMLIVGIACALASAGLWRDRPLALKLALAILLANLCGDLLNTLLRHDYRSLVGVPISGALIIFLIIRMRRGAEPTLRSPCSRHV